MYYIVFLIIAVLVIVLDQITKAIVVDKIPLGESVEVIDGVFRFTHIQNRGAAFGMLKDQRWIFLILSTLAIIAIIVFVIKKKPRNKLLLTALSLIVGGGIGNMIDRTYLGYVVDFLDFCAFPSLWKWIFNVADSAACIGAALLFLYLICDTVKSTKTEKKLAAAANADVISSDTAENSADNASKKAVESTSEGKAEDSADNSTEKSAVKKDNEEQ